MEQQINSLFDDENIHTVRTYDKRQNILSTECRNGFWQKYTFDEHDNVLTFKDSNGASYEYVRTYHENGHIKTQTYKDSSGGFLYSKHDENGIEIS